jgi:ATPase subunit of ABC transporter with duplicated ATPase domains
MVRFIPKRQVCLVVGKAGEGKSTFAAWLTAALTTGEYPDHEGTVRQHEPVNVYLNAREDPLHELTIGRLRTAGIDEERVVLEENMWELPKDLGLLRDRIGDLAADGFPPGAVILDLMIGHFRNP